MPLLTFLGAARTVTGSRHLVETGGHRVLVDCGLFQGSYELRRRNWDDLPVKADTIDAVVLTHAHLDHVGYLPRLVKQGFQGRVFCTAGTQDLAHLILVDSAHLQEEDARRANQGRYSRHDPALPLYTVADAWRALGMLQPVGYDRAMPVVDGVEVRFVPMGHLLGAAAVVMQLAESGQTIVFGGDLGRYGRPVLPDPESIPDADVLLCESTYGDRLHEPDDQGARLAAVVSETAARGGKVIIPAFAIGRVEEVLYWLKRLEDEKRIPVLPVYVDSPMAIEGLRLHVNRSSELDAELQGSGRKLTPFATRRFECVASPRQSADLVESTRPAIVVSSSGMATGGRVLMHLAKTLPDPRNTVLFVGFQAAGTRGRSLVDGVKQVKMLGRQVDVAARIERIDAMSAHADQSEILRWLGGFSKPPGRSFIVHGEPEAQDALRAKIAATLGWEAHCPEVLGTGGTVTAAGRKYLLERVGEAAVVQIYADGFEQLSPREKILCWHLGQAAIAGRDIYYDQRYAHGLAMRRVLEAVVMYPGQTPREVLDAIWQYLKLFWIHTGPFNNLTARKFVPSCTPEAFDAAVHEAVRAGARLPLEDGESVDALLVRLRAPFFDRAFEPVVTNKTPGAGRDILEASANNLYVGVTMAEVEAFTERYPLNSRLAKADGTLVEEVYRVGGRYSAEIARIVEHLEAAIPFATDPMAAALRALVKFYRTGETEDRRQYDIAWVADQASPVDTMNGFIEVYMDARGVKGAWEAIVYYVHPGKTAHARAIAEHAQWFEDRMPWAPQYRKPRVTGITARAVEVVIETGDAGPMTPIGVNLPNDQEIRETHGSKSVSLSNVTEAYEKSTPRSYRAEFAWSQEEVDRAERWGAFASELTTNLHEIIGHGSGLVSPALKGAPEKALKEHFSAIEEARADLVALYFIGDAYLAEIGVVPAADQQEIVLAEYESYARNALVQLRRIREGTQIEEDHMRNRQLVVHWLLANTASLEMAKRDGKTYYRLVDVRAFTDGAGTLLAEVQRIKAEGDYQAASELLETYGVHFDPDLRDEVVRRVEALDLASYTAFVMPELTPVHDERGEIADILISYPQDFAAQMLGYGRSR